MTEKDFLDDLHRVDLLERRPVVAVEELAELGHELLLPLLRVPDAEIAEPGRSASTFSFATSMKRRVALETSSSVSLRQGRSPPPDLVRREHEDVRRVRVAVEEAVAKDHRHPRLREHMRDPATLVQRVPEHFDIGELCAFDELEGQHSRPRVGPEDARHLDMWVASEVLAKCLGVARLEPVVELLPDRARELVDEPLASMKSSARTRSFARRAAWYIRLRSPRSGAERRTLHLHRNATSVRENGVRGPGRSTPQRWEPGRTRGRAARAAGPDRPG